MKDHQLRVRLSGRHYSKLKELSSSRRFGETISDVVRQAIEAFVEPQLRMSENAEYLISDNAKSAVQKLATQLGRKPAHVIEDCVEGMVDLHEQKKTPVIILELELRKKYFEDKKGVEHRPVSDKSHAHR